MNLLEAWHPFYEGLCQENIWINGIIWWQVSDSRSKRSEATIELEKHTSGIDSTVAVGTVAGRMQEPPYWRRHFPSSSSKVRLPESFARWAARQFKYLIWSHPSSDNVIVGLQLAGRSAARAHTWWTEAREVDLVGGPPLIGFAVLHWTMEQVEAGREWKNYHVLQGFEPHQLTPPLEYQAKPDTKTWVRPRSGMALGQKNRRDARGKSKTNWRTWFPVLRPTWNICNLPTLFSKPNGWRWDFSLKVNFVLLFF